MTCSVHSYCGCFVYICLHEVHLHTSWSPLYPFLDYLLWTSGLYSSLALLTDLNKDKVKAAFQIKEINHHSHPDGSRPLPFGSVCLPALASASVTPMCPALSMRRLGTASASALLCNVPGRIASPQSAKERRASKPTVLPLPPLLDLPHYLPLLSLRMLRISLNMQEMQVFISIFYVISSLHFSSILILNGMQTQVLLLI